MDKEIGRPTIYSEDKLTIARDYMNGGWELEGDAVPQISGLALAMGVDRTVLYDWAKDPDKKEFTNIFMRVKALQERKLVNGGLTNLFNPAVTKMLLSKHGYSDRIEQDHQSSDGSMKPVSKISIEVLDAAQDSGD